MTSVGTAVRSGQTSLAGGTGGRRRSIQVSQSILTGSGFTSWQEDVRGVFVYNHAQLSLAATMMRRALKKYLKGKGQKGLFGMDSAMVVRRICKPIEDAAALQLVAAQAVGVSHENYCQYIASPAKAQGAFNPNK